ncbi:MAG: DUF4465 domain-containing protein [Planctomycetes bacterium]|nr:DUF4465 domain-containing protein [Planctomycetota bacterium]
MKWKVFKEQMANIGIRGDENMASGRLMKFWNLVCITIVLVMAGIANADIASFEDLDLPTESYWNGSDGSGGFTSGGAHFGNNYNVDWDSWDGFSYSNTTDTTDTTLAGQYNAIAGAGQGGSPNYAVAYIGWTSPPTMTLSEPGIVDGLYTTNNNFTYYAMLQGDAFSKKFGGENGDDQDWFMLTITGKDVDGAVTSVVEFYLADYRFADNSDDYILDTWQYVDLTSLGMVKSLEFALSSSDVGQWGMNTPAYFAIDTLVSQSVYDRPYTEAGVNGYINPENNWQHADPQDPNAVINPIFRGWATEVVSYQPAPGLDPQWTDPTMALGPATGDKLDIVSLGDLNQEQIDQSLPPGQITLYFDEPIRQGNGYDFVVFENGFISSINSDNGSVSGQMFTELGYVEVSSNGNDFIRFPAVSLTGEAAGQYVTLEISKIYNLAGKHPNAYGICTGTPFDLQEIAEDPKVVSGLVDVNDIRYVRIVDIPGSGDFSDEAMLNIDPGTWPGWDFYQNNHPIYDVWPTYGSGGLDLEAVGVLREQNYSADIDLNGIVDVSDFELLISAMDSHFGQPEWIARCDLAEPKDLVIDISDVSVFLDQWLKTEQWRN